LALDPSHDFGGGKSHFIASVPGRRKP